ncbi:MAG: transglycosylase SLT domain-containing protein [Gammaproteobacteria bacterium]
MNTLKKYLHSIHQYRMPGTRALQQELDAVRESHAADTAELAKVREDLQHAHDADVELLADLRQQIKQVKSERRHAHHQVELLERSVTHAEQRQKFTEAHVTTLEAKLEEERNRYEASMQATEARQTRLQAEQQSQLARQTELANTFHRVSTRLFESIQEGKKRQRYSLLQLITIAGVLFAGGTLVGVLFMPRPQDTGQELVAVERDIRDMRGFMKQHIDNQDALLKELALKLNRQTSTEQLLLGEKPLQLEVLTQATDTPQQEAVTFTPDIHELQANLMALGFDLGMSKPNGEQGIKTRQALQEFRQFYLPQGDVEGDLFSEPLVVMILNSADLARADAARFRIDSDALAAIRLGSIRTGVDFSFLMELARVESNFNPAARAPKSSATGLYQFKPAPWLQAVRTHGASYGLQDYATRVTLIDNGEDEQQPIMHDPLQQEVLALRLNPRLSTLLVAENIKHDLRELAALIGREPGRTELYLTHFFGTEDAVMFLKALDEQPTAIAAGLFPETAASNPGVFQGRQQPRSVAGVYQWFDGKFNTARYDDRTPG